MCCESRARCQVSSALFATCVLAHTASKGFALLSASTASLQPQQQEAGPVLLVSTVNRPAAKAQQGHTGNACAA